MKLVSKHHALKRCRALQISHTCVHTVCCCRCNHRAATCSSNVGSSQHTVCVCGMSTAPVDDANAAEACDLMAAGRAAQASSAPRGRAAEQAPSPVPPRFVTVILWNIPRVLQDPPHPVPPRANSCAGASISCRTAMKAAHTCHTFRTQS